MRTLSIDIETFSSVNLLKSGVYAYTESQDFEILLFAYAFDDEEVRIIDFAKGEKLSGELVDALKDENIIKTAFNAAFERICLSKHLNTKLHKTVCHFLALHTSTIFDGGLANYFGQGGASFGRE